MVFVLPTLPNAMGRVYFVMAKTALHPCHALDKVVSLVFVALLAVPVADATTKIVILIRSASPGFVQISSASSLASKNP